MEAGSRCRTGVRCVLAIVLLPTLLITLVATGYAASDESRTEAYFESIRKDPNLLLAFLREMPKGGDLHNHLTGSIYAESYIQLAAKHGDCVDPKSFSILAGPCTAPAVPASIALSDPNLYAHMIDALSMRNWQLSGQSGHDHFFDAFGKYAQATEGATDKLLAETASRAASQREVYQELMLTPTGKDLETLARKLGEEQHWDADFGHGRAASDADFETMRQALLDNGLPEILTTARAQLEQAEAQRNAGMHCGTPQSDPGCEVVQRFLAQVSRGKSKDVVFAQMLAGFLLSGADPAAVPPAAHMSGINLVMPEDWYIPMLDFSLQMRMLNYLHKKYPRVHITLHAGELVEGLVTPEGLQFHVRDSVEIGHAERIGHGVDIMNEPGSLDLMREMAQNNVMVEICLTSNDVILGVRGAEHPLRDYIRAGVPVALATDDEGVARSDMTHEYLKGAQEQDLSYLQLKKMARTSLERAFLGGPSLWRDGKMVLMMKECTTQKPNFEKPPPACQKFLDGSEKARLQWKLEWQFRQFESRPWTSPFGSTRPAATE